MSDRQYAAIDRISRRTLQHIRRGTPLSAAWADAVKLAAPVVGRRTAKLAAALPVNETVTDLATRIVARLAMKDAPDATVNGLWFGLVELITDERAITTRFCLYIAGSGKFDPRNRDWPCAPVWMPENIYFPCAAIDRLSDARRNADSSFAVDCGLVEPLTLLLVSRIARDVHPELLLGPARRRGIGAGFDSGDLHTLGVVTKKGFEPIAKPPSSSAAP